MMKTKTNLIDYSLNYDKLNECYDFFIIKTSNKYIYQNSLFIDIQNYCKCESVAFDGGISLFLMFQKNKIDTNELNNFINDDFITINKLYGNEIKDYIILRLLFNSLANSKYEENKYSNISGRLIIYKNEWISKNQKSIKCIDVSVSEKLNDLKLDLNSCYFNNTKLFKTNDYIKYPKYTFSFNGTFKRVIDESNADNLFIRKSYNGKKAEIGFLSFNKKNMKLTKSFLMYEIIDRFNKRFNGIANVNLKELNIIKKIENIKDVYFLDTVVDQISKYDINFTNFDYSKEDILLINKFIEKLNNLYPNIKYNKTDKLDINKLNIYFVHNKDYYKNANINDPYKSLDRKIVTQCVTIEDAVCSNSNVIVNTILKELLIKKNLLIDNTITIDNWEDYNFNESFYFGTKESSIFYFIEIKPSGKILKYKDDGLFGKVSNNNFKIREIKQRLKDMYISDGMLIISYKGSINIIESTGINTYPYFDIFNSDSPRGKESRNNYLCGITDINYYNYKDCFYYNVGPIGKGLIAELPKGSLLYKVILVEGESLIEKLLETMSVMFVKYNSFTVLPYPFKYLREWVLMNN